MATLNEIASALRKADAAGDTESAQRLAQAYSRQKSKILSLIEEPKEKAGFFGSFKEAVTSLGLADEAAAFAANPTEENRKEFLKKAESKYKSVGGFGKGENWEAFKELLGSSLGALAAPIGAAVVGGGLPGFAAASAGQYSIANLQRQAEAQQAAAEAGQAIPEVSLGKAAAAAAAQTGLDVIPGALILKGLRSFPLAQRLLSEDKLSSQAANVLIDAFKNKNLSLKGNVAKGVGLGVAFEVPQEIAQQALERWQAGLSLTDDEAKEEFKQAAIGAALLGGGFGAIGGYATYRGEQAEKARAAEAEAASRQEEEIAPPPPPPITPEIPAVPEETEDQLEARLEREAIQEIEREAEERLNQQLQRGQYNAQTLREAAEAESLAPREDEEPPLYTPQVEPVEFVAPSDFRYTVIESPNYDLAPLSLEDADFELEVLQQQAERGRLTPQNFAQSEIGSRLDTAQIGAINDGLRSDPVNTIKALREKLAPPKEASTAEMPEVFARTPTEGVMEGLGAPVEGGIPAEMFEDSFAESKRLKRDYGEDYSKFEPADFDIPFVPTETDVEGAVLPKILGKNESGRMTDIANWVRDTEYVPVSWLKSIQPGNPIDERDVQQLVQDLDKYGLNDPITITVGKENRIAKISEGNHRLEAARRLGYTHMPARVLIGDNISGGVGRVTRKVDADLIPQAGEYFRHNTKPSNVFKSLAAPTTPSTEGVMEGLGAPTEGGIPAEMLAPTARETALEVIKTTPTIKAVAEATGLNQPKAAALMRQFVDEGILARKGNKFVLAAPEATDVSGTPSVDTETDRGSDRGSLELFALESPTGELGAVPTRGAGLDTTGDVTERVDERERTVPPALETEGALEGLGAPTEGGIPSEELQSYLSEREKARDLKQRALDFIRQTGKGGAFDLQKALDISLRTAKALRSALLGSGAVVQKSNVKGAKTAERSYFVVEGDYVPTGRFASTAPKAKQETVAETGFEELGLEEAPAETGLPPDMLESYFTEQRLEEARRRATGKLLGEGVESESERSQREADKLAEITANIERKLPPTLNPEIGKGEYGLQYQDPEAGTVYRAYPTVGERNEARAQLAKEGKKDFKTFSRMAEAAKFELSYAKSVATPAMSKAQLRRAVEGIRAGMSKIKSQIGLFTEEEAPTPKKPVPKRVTAKEIVEYANRVIALARDANKLKKYSTPIGRILELVNRGETDLRTEFKKLQDIETRIKRAEQDVGEATQADLEEISDIDIEETEEGEVRVKERDESYEPLDFRKAKYTRFKKKKSQVKGMRLETVVNLIGKMIVGWKNPPNFTVVQSYLDLPEGLNVESNADNMGLAIGNDVYIIADNIRLLSDLKAVVFHESLGHYGLEQLFGKRLLQTMLDIYRTNNRMQADADAWLAENPDTYPESEYTLDERRALATEEVFAEMSESGQIMRDPKMRSAFNRVAALIRKFARALSQLVGRDLAYTNAEINDIIAQAHNKVITGKTRVVPRYNNIRYMNARHKKILTDAMGKAQNAPKATREILIGTVDALSNVSDSLRNAKLQTFSLHHMMQLFEKYAPAFRALNNLVERKAYDSTKEMVEFTKQASKYRKILRNNSRFVDEFNKVAHLINLSQAPVLEEQVNANGDFVRFVPNVASQRMRNIPANSAAYNALTPDEKVLYEAVNRFYALPTDVQQVITDIYTDYRNYSENAFQIKLTQLMNKLPANVIAGIKANFQNNRLRFYLPLPREGLYRLDYFDNNNVEVVRFFDSKAGRDYAEQQVSAQGMTVLSNRNTIVKQRDYNGISSLPPGLLKELLENVRDSLTRANVADADIVNAERTVFDTFIEYMPGAYGNDLRQEVSSRKTFMLNNAMYYGRLGFEEDVIAAYEKRVPGIIYQINNLKYTMPFEKVRKLIKEQLNTYTGNKSAPAYTGLPDLDDSYIDSLKNDLDSRITFAKSLQQYSPYVYTIGKANYIYSIALNISSAMINTTILPMMAWPALAAKYGLVNASRAVGQAIQLFFKHSYRDPQTGRLNFDYKRLADMPASFGGNNMPAAYAQTAHGQEFNRFYRTLLARSVVGTAAEQELIQAENITVPGYEGLSAKANLLMSYVFRSSERMNREVSALAAYMLARNIDVNGQAFDPNRQGVSIGKASEEAIRLNYDINGATTPETNSRLYQTDIGRIALTFRTHALNMILNLAFSFNQAIERINSTPPANSTPAQIAQFNANVAEKKLLKSLAQKKLLYIFGSTYMLAGIKGLPLFGAAEVLASLIMGDDDEPYDLEQEVLDSVGTLGLNGPINELLNVDIGSRTGFYGLLWRDDPKRLAEVGIPVYVLERIAGPTYGLVEAARRGFNDLAEGDLQRGFEALLPAPLRNGLKGMRYGIEGALTRDGLPIVEDVNAYNSIMQILGFAPADLATAQAQRGATYEVSEKLKNRRVALLTNLYAARKADNAEGMEKALEDIRKFNESNPSYRITGDTISKSYKERERRAREAIMGVYQPRNLRIATSEYVTDLNAEDADAFF